MKVNIMGPYTTMVDYGPSTLTQGERYRRLRDAANLDQIDRYASTLCNLWGFQTSGIVVRKLAVIFFEKVMDIEDVCKVLKRKHCTPADHADLLSLVKARHYEPDGTTIIAPNSRVSIPVRDQFDTEHDRYLAYTHKKNRRKLVTVDDDLLKDEGILFRWGLDSPMN